MAEDAAAPSSAASGCRDNGLFASEDLSGREIAGCRLLRKIGQGAMGAVYLAEQIKLRRQVAFKVLDPKFSRDLTYIERFEREAQAAARLVHYNVVQVFDYGRSGDIYYIVNEYVDGGSVQQRIDAAGALVPGEAAAFVIQACQGLAAAEEQHIVHRDIKPENLMLTKAGVIKIADFGLAKVVTDDAAVTQSGMIVGTPFYMSPEQAKGMPLDIRSDIYSLGVSFYHMLTGQLPFDADSVIGVLLKQISAERPDPSLVNPAVPSAFGAVVMRMMARTPEERFQSTRELLPALERLRDIASGKIAMDEMAATITLPPGDRFSRYKILPGNCIIRFERREVKPAVAARLTSLLKGDAGVFIETTASLPDGSVVEVRFRPPGRAEEIAAVGIVRWTHSGERPGVGVTFVKAAAVPTAESSRRLTAAPPPAMRLPPGDMVKLLTQSPLHCRLLRYAYANAGQAVDVVKIAGALGVSQRLLAPTMQPFEMAGMLRRHSNGMVDLIWPEDEELQREIVGWVSKYGLK